uniref:Nonstructural protein 1 n=1 Tax=Hamaparvovirinae sp. TaxID=2809447 RepID=A0AAU7P154_9VIRU
MQNPMERSRRALIGCRRFTWNGKAVTMEKKEDVQLDRQQTIHQLHVMNAQTWQAGVLSIGFPNGGGQPVNDPRPYAICLANIKSVKAWLLCGENNQEGIFHVHAMALTLQRSDAFRRSIEREWFNNRMQIMDDCIEDPDPILDVLKMQKCHKPESLIAYMCKDPLWICTSDDHYTNIMSAVWMYDMGERFRIKQQEKLAREQANDGNVNKIVSDVLNVIYDHSCKTLEDCMKSAPDVMSQYLHRAGFSSIINNCLTFVQATASGWSLNRIACKHESNPSAIHKCLLHQGLNVTAFDVIFFKWITKALPKHNTLVLWGPSNTGKSAFISGFKQCVQWGEIVNSNTFAFEGLIGNGFGIWEEPLISPELAEKAKQIFEGMECSIPVKFKKPAKLHRTPILMTTNHAPWRFCTHEEEMFKNRMFIFEWNYDTSSGILTYRNSSESCSCSSCKGSRGSETDNDIQPTSGVQGTEQSIQLDGPTDSECDVRSRPVSRTRKRKTPRRISSSSSGSEDSRGNNIRHSSSPSRANEQCSNSTGSSSSTSTPASNSIRPSGDNRSSDSNIRVLSTKPRNAVAVVTPRNRSNNGGHPKRNRVGSTRDGGSDEGAGHSRWVGGEYGYSREMVELEQGEKTTEIKIPTEQPIVGGNLVSLKQAVQKDAEKALTIPDRNMWLQYLSYLQNTYG